MPDSVEIETKAIQRLSPKHRAFVEAYLRCWNASEAARQAGYKGRANTVGPRLLANVGIQVEIERRLSEIAMSSDEVLARLAEQARGEHGKYITSEGQVDISRLIADGKGYLVKAIRPTAHGIAYEFYDSQSALVWIGKHFRLFIDRTDLTSDGKPLTIRVVYDDDGPDGK